MTVNNYQTGTDSFIELPHDVSHSHKNNRAAHDATEAERNPRNEDMYTHKNTHTHTHRLGAFRLNTRITIRNIG